MIGFTRERRVWSLSLAAVVLLLFSPLAAAEDPPEFELKWGTLGLGDGQFYWDGPTGVATDADGNVYVVDGTRIQKFSGDGTFLAKWGSRGTGDGQFEFAWGIATDTKGNVYVSEWNGHNTGSGNRIQKFSSDGKFLAKWGSYGSGDGQFKKPLYLATDASGDVYVADVDNNRIQKFSSNGTFLTKWGSYGTGDGQFDAPIGIATDADGRVFVADGRNNRIQVFSSDGTFLAKWTCENPYGVATDVSGNVYVSSGHPLIRKFSGDGTLLTQWGSGGAGDGQFYLPAGVATDTAGNVYIADSGNYRMQKFAPAQLLQLNELIDEVITLNLQQGIANSLDAKLNAALDALTDFAEGNNVAAVNALQAFVSAVSAQSGKMITVAQANELITEAEAIIELLEGGG